jgi:hypothetical protein
MITPYSSIINYDKPDLKEYLAKIELLDIFKPLLKEFKDITLFRGAVKFILYAYSLESEVLHSNGITWLQMVKIVYEKSGLPDNVDIFDKVSNFKSEGLRESVENWLQFQDSESFTQYCHYRDLRKQCLQTSTSADKLKDRMDALVYSKELLKMMEETKSGFIENYESLKPSVNAFIKTAKRKNTLSINDYAT